MLQFSKLRLQGFKSFVDRTEVEIDAGLTGIVGPNGCGKSNIVDGLRWSMGESSTKRMRGGSASMEDVIFSGTETRPARNIAEVSVLLDNSEGSAPAPYAAQSEIEVVRKIERDHGSTYRINGKVVRARDVQLLYADILSGANSPFLVSQGKITNIINAKPSNRRAVLEDAAGISGLHARRHEAELRLKATDNNIKRLEDLIGTMESRLQNLKKQARQAARYKTLSEKIRHLEVQIAYLEHHATYKALKDVQNHFSAAESLVAENLLTVTQLTKTQNTQAAGLPELRQEDVEMAASLQSQKIALQRLEDEKERLSQQIAEAQTQKEQTLKDQADTAQTLKDNEATLEALGREEVKLQTIETNQSRILEEKQVQQNTFFENVQRLEKNHNEALERFAEKRAQKQNIEARIEQNIIRKDEQNQRLLSLKTQLTELQNQSNDQNDIEALQISISEFETQSTKLRARRDKVSAEIETLEQQEKEDRARRQEFKESLSTLDAEITALSDIVQIGDDTEQSPVLEHIKTQSGFETALSRAMGDFLMGSTDNEAPIVWTNIKHDHKDMPALPNETKSLLEHIEAPPALSLALSQIGIIDTEQAGHDLAAKLKPGQSLVSKSGFYWRWDGLFVKESASDRHSIFLKQKNKLSDLKFSYPETEKAFNKAEAALQKTQQRRETNKNTLRSLQDSIEEAERAIKNSRDDIDSLMQKNAARLTELAKMEESMSLTKEDIQLLDTRLTEDNVTLQTFDDKTLEQDNENFEALKTKLSSERELYQSAMQDYEIARQEAGRRKARLRGIGDERVSLQNRCIRGRERLKELDARLKTLNDKENTFKERPKTIDTDIETLLTSINAKEENRQKVSDKLALMESELAETTRALKEAEAYLSTAREKRARAQATIEERQKHLDEVTIRIAEQFDCPPKALGTMSKIDPENLPDLNETKEAREKLSHQRHAIGPVNLRAEIETQAVESEFGTILNERAELAESVEELRNAIDKLNAEAKERLQVAFEQVNGYFRDVFTRLFDGGKAHLALLETDDPMGGGLEIYAQPPGKALQSLSLLSGGEQTLTALALIFAMFLTNPAPICVLDEVDAPLDDANVDRFCDLLEEFAEKGQTRFLVITHHRLTMARMDRLYGVTMTEKGISQLVSVDLNQQFDFLEAAE